ncbi:HAMP domain-containing histidine kinase [Streptomyces sp. NBC_01239]|uniref:sensor histidine kinase n=1 Tax=Streptomyces sp. NBC_01239 TaxID=2903792 RepID=UPI00225683FF|nr:HAMP domain-containing sensor histidine kinase [Streptomyces sp. NBC_01239]MCX4817789.1 HAMP domain-containing histidine kinase [Streptomyces sp. NBC_01239]
MPRPLASVRARAALAATLVVSFALVVTGIAVIAVLRNNLTDRAALESEVTARTVAGAQAALTGDFTALDLPDDRDRLVQVVDSGGRVLAAGDALHGRRALTNFAPAPAPTGTPSTTPTRSAAPTATSTDDDDDDSGDDHGGGRGSGRGSGRGGDESDDTRTEDTSSDDDATGAPARGKVSTDVDRETLAVRFGDRGHDYGFAAVQGTTYDGRTYTVYAGTSLADEQATLDQVTRTMLAALPFLLLVVAGVTWLVTRRALRPVEGIRAEMAAITGSGDLTRRVPVPRSRDEVGRLARTTNQTLAALEQSVERQHRFVADASHELRSPIASLRTQIEVADQHPGLLDTGDLHHDVVRLQHLAADLLLLARLDAGEQPGHALLDLRALVRDEVARRAPTDRVAPEVVADDEEVPQVLGSRGQLARVLGNLLDNAQRHTATAITVTLARAGDDVVLTVADDGHGVAPADRPRVFERFVRLDEARSRDDGGAGLGLAIARDVVRNHGGDLTVTESPSGGAAFLVTLPRAPQGTGGAHA